MKNPKFQIFIGKDNQFYFRLRAKNGEIILGSEGYVTKSDCQNDISSVKENASKDALYLRKTAVDGQFYFVLTAPNNEVIGVSEMYTTERQRNNGIEAVKKTVPDAPIEDKAKIQPLGNSVPTGSIVAWPTEYPPGGWLECNGAAISRKTYSRLYSAIGTMYGNGDGSTTFNIPDFRGEFLRGWAHERTTDKDRASRANRGDGTRGNHVGTKQKINWKSFYTNPVRYERAACRHIVYPSGHAYAGKYIYSPRWEQWGEEIMIGKYISYSGGYPITLFRYSWDDSEVHPRNVSVMYIIKY